MATLVDRSQSSQPGSYFDLLYEKYPDLAPAASTRPTAPETGGDGDDDGDDVSLPRPTPTQRAAESRWVPLVLFLLLGLALVFPPALMWQPSWLPDASGEAVAPIVAWGASDEPALQVAFVDDGATDSAVAQTPAAEPVQPKAPDSEPSDPATGASITVSEVSPKVAPSLASNTADARDGSSKMPPPQARLIAESTDPLPVAPVAVAQQNLPTVTGHGEASPAASNDDIAGMLEVATASPRIQPARRLAGDTPQLAVSSLDTAARLRLRTHINPEGRVVGVDILQGISEAEDRRVADVLRRWQYAPATVDGRPVSSQQEVVFVLQPTGTAQLAENEPIEPARRRLSPLPGYTTEAWIQGTEGEVELLASIDVRGHVTDVEVLQGLPHGLTHAAVQAVERWKFDPARHKGEAIASTQRLRLRFAL